MARQFVRSARRKTQWAGFGTASGGGQIPPFENVNVGVSSILSQVMMISSAAGIVDEETTITRMIGRFTAALNVTTAGAEATVRVGCLVVRTEALAAGVAALPSVEDDPDSEWLFHGGVALLNPNSTLKDGPGSFQTIQFDVRGQRIVKSGMTPVWLCESETTNVRAQVDGRYLVKLV